MSPSVENLLEAMAHALCTLLRAHPENVCCTAEAAALENYLEKMRTARDEWESLEDEHEG